MNHLKKNDSISIAIGSHQNQPSLFMVQLQNDDDKVPSIDLW
jgi:hypothetical protein